MSEEVLPGIVAFPYGCLVEGEAALVVADLHLGFEEVLADSGIFLPATQLDRISSMIVRRAAELGADRVILLGDVKHEFGSATRQEWAEVLELLRRLRGVGLSVEVVRGNHDNFLIPILRREGVPLHDPHLMLGDLLLAHGHRPLPEVEFRAVLIGHEHPAVAVPDEFGVRRRFRALLVGRVRGRSLAVLPAVSPLAPGTDVLSAEAFLSPVLEEAEDLVVYAVDEDVGVVRLGPLETLRAVTRA